MNHAFIHKEKGKQILINQVVHQRRRKFVECIRRTNQNKKWYRWISLNTCHWQVTHLMRMRTETRKLYPSTSAFSLFHSGRLIWHTVPLFSSVFLFSGDTAGLPKIVLQLGRFFNQNTLRVCQQYQIFIFKKLN